MARGRQSNHQSDAREGAKTWLIGPYLRLSREDEKNGESESIGNQQDIVDDFIASYFNEPYEVVDYFKDDGLTGTDDTREDFIRLIQYIEQGKVNCVVCKTLARAFRNYSDQGYYLEYYFQQKKVRFISIGDPKIDTFENPEAITGFEVPISGIMNDRFASRTSNDVRRTLNSKRKRGEFIGAFPPYGYLKDEKDKNHLVLDEEIAQLKREILDWVVRDGMSWMGAAKRLNEMGVPNPTAYKQRKGWRYQNPHIKSNDAMWSGTTLKRIMLDRVNLGHMVQGRQRVISYKVHDREAMPESEWFVVENTHQPTFTQGEYKTLVGIATKDTRTANNYKTRSLLSGFVRCANCGKAMHRHSARNITYYHCRTYQEKSKSVCTKHTIREDVLESTLFSAIQAQVQLLTSLAALITKIKESPVINTQSQRIERMLSEKQSERKKARMISDSLYADWKTGDITRDDYARMKAMYDGQINALTDAIANLEHERIQLDTVLRSESTLLETFAKAGNIQKLDRGILSEMIDVVLVHEKKEVTIRFRYADELARILEVIEQKQQ